MEDPKVFIVHLRRPRRHDATETRADPFFEVGSFGCTGCHSKNLMNLRSADAIDGARLAFAQGGPGGFRLVLLTPPINVVRWKAHCEATWTPAMMPFKYEHAPVLVRNNGDSDFPALKRLAQTTHRSKPEGGFSSRFRSRVRPLNSDISSELITTYESFRAGAPSSQIATDYMQAMPYPPPVQDRKRKMSYRAKIAALKQVKIKKRAC